MDNQEKFRQVFYKALTIDHFKQEKNIKKEAVTELVLFFAFFILFLFLGIFVYL